MDTSTLLYPLTVGDLPSDAQGVRHELIDGSLYVTPLADRRHQLLCQRVREVLGQIIPPELVALGPINLVVDDTTLLIPDVAVVPRVPPADAAGLGWSPAEVLLVARCSRRRRAGAT